MLERWIKKLDTMNNAFALVRQIQSKETQLLAEMKENIERMEKTLDAFV